MTPLARTTGGLVSGRDRRTTAAMFTKRFSLFIKSESL